MINMHISCTFPNGYELFARCCFRTVPYDPGVTFPHNKLAGKQPLNQ